MSITKVPLSVVVNGERHQIRHILDFYCTDDWTVDADQRSDPFEGIAWAYHLTRIPARNGHAYGTVVSVRPAEYRTEDGGFHGEVIWQAYEVTYALPFGSAKRVWAYWSREENLSADDAVRAYVREHSK